MRITRVFRAFSSESFMERLPCSHCIYSFYEPREKHISTNLSKCVKYGEKDLRTGQIVHDYTQLCRKDESKCGKEGKYFMLIIP